MDLQPLSENKNFIRKWLGYKENIDFHTDCKRLYGLTGLMESSTTFLHKDQLDTATTGSRKHLHGKNRADSEAWTYCRNTDVDGKISRLQTEISTEQPNNNRDKGERNEKSWRNEGRRLSGEFFQPLDVRHSLSAYIQVSIRIFPTHVIIYVLVYTN